MGRFDWIGGRLMKRRRVQDGFDSGIVYDYYGYVLPMFILIASVELMG